jgi:hypothetical protein
MTRADLAREWFDACQDLRNDLQRIRLDAHALGKLKPDSPFPRNIDDAVRKLAARVAAFDAFVAGYVGSSDSGRVSVKG